MKSTTQFKSVPIFTLEVRKEKCINYTMPRITDAVAANQLIKSAAEVFQKYLGNLDCENLVILLVDGNNNFIGLSTVSIGSLSKLQVSMRDIFKHALIHRASAFILAHQHCSNDVNPSQEDKILTDKVVEAGKIIGVPLIDHLIVSGGIDEKYFSFLENGLIK